MINLLIPTRADDLHAIYVKLALEKLGHHADIWYTPDFPTLQTHSFYLKNNTVTWHSDGLECIIKNEYDIVWYRRPSKPILSDQLHLEDIDNSRKENISFFQSIWQTILPNATWINPPNSAARANSKLLQLQIAAKIGLLIPPTLMSNNPANIRQFISESEKKIIYKTLYPISWLKNDEVRLTYANIVALNNLPSDAILQSTPGIFQHKIEKQYELRITYFGNKFIAVKINSQEHPKAILDWRRAPAIELRMEQVTIPDIINQQCQQLMKELNIIFGCFDFIVTPNNEYFFLEVNEQGQFLWIEEVNPNIKMLGAFIEFIITVNGAENPLKEAISMDDFKLEAIQVQSNAIRHHKDCNAYS